MGIVLTPAVANATFMNGPRRRADEAGCGYDQNQAVFDHDIDVNGNRCERMTVARLTGPRQDFADLDLTVDTFMQSLSRTRNRPAPSVIVVRNSHGPIRMRTRAESNRFRTMTRCATTFPDLCSRLTAAAFPTSAWVRLCLISVLTASGNARV